MSANRLQCLHWLPCETAPASVKVDSYDARPSSKCFLQQVCRAHVLRRTCCRVPCASAATHRHKRHQDDWRSCTESAVRLGRPDGRFYRRRARHRCDTGRREMGLVTVARSSPAKSLGDPSQQSLGDPSQQSLGDPSQQSLDPPSHNNITILRYSRHEFCNSLNLNLPCPKHCL